MNKRITEVQIDKKIKELKKEEINSLDLFLKNAQRRQKIIFLGPLYKNKLNFPLSVSIFEHYFKILPQDTKNQVKYNDIPHLIVDGGIDHYYPKTDKHYNYLSIGDGDSIRSKNKSLSLKLPREKDYSDFAFALNLIKKIPIKKILVLGFLGGRSDHQLINFGEISYLLKRKQNVVASLERKVFAFSKGVYELDFTGTFSLICFDTTNIKLTGQIKYPLKKETTIAPLSAYTLSNEAFGKCYLETKKPLFLFIN